MILKVEKGTILRARISKSDFKNIRHIARKTSCRVKLEVKNGLPFIMKRYNYMSTRATLIIRINIEIIIFAFSEKKIINFIKRVCDKRKRI